MAVTGARALPFTGDPEADALLVQDPLALLVGLALDQQVPVEKAFSGPLALSRRLGGLDAARIAAMDPGELEHVFRERPAIHRFPGAMAARVRELCAVVAEEHGGRAERIWTEAASGEDLAERIAALPGFGPMKVETLVAILAKRLGVRPPGWEDVVPGHPTLGDVDSPEALAAYQAAKRARKASVRADKAARA